MIASYSKLKAKILQTNKLLCIWVFATCIGFSSCVFANDANEQYRTEKALLEQIENLTVKDINEAKKLLDLAKKNELINDSASLRSQLENLIAFHAILSGDYESAAVALQNAQGLAKRSGNKLQLAESLRREGILMTFLDQYSQALFLLNEAFLIHSELNSDKISNTIDSLLNVYWRLEQWDELERYANLLLEISTKEGMDSQIGGAHYTLATVYIHKEEYERARFHVNELLKPNILQNSNIPSFSYVAKAKLEAALGNTELALVQVRLAKQMLLDRDFTSVLPEVTFREAEILLLGGKVDEAILLLEDVVDNANGSSNKFLLTKILQKLSQIYRDKNDFERALYFSNQYQTIQNEMMRMNERQLLALNQAKVDLSSKDLQIKTLEFEKDLSIQRQTYQTIIIVITSLMLLILVAVSTFIYQQKQKLKDMFYALEKASNTKSEFLARMSHEIRTPINAIIGLTKLSLKSSNDSAQSENLQQIEESSQTLLGVINDVLDFSKIEAGELYLSNIEFELQDIIDRALRLNALKAFEKNIELSSKIARDVPVSMVGDPLRVQQVLNNLISNAIKFTETGSVNIFVFRRYYDQSLTLEFEVRDTGIGINMEDSSKLFDSFSQADESITRVYGGTGLGLAICKQLVELMKGKIWIESRPKGGTSVFFTIQLHETKSSPRFEISPDNLKSQKVLVIDDLAISRESIINTLAELDIQADQAIDGSEGICKFRQAQREENPYDLIFIDWKMPNIDGIEVASVIRQESISRPPNIVMMTNVDMQSLQSQGKALGINLYLEKPISPEKLVNALLGHHKREIHLTNKSKTEILFPDFSHLHILLVDDNRLNRKVAKAYLSDTKAQVTTAENGEKAIELLKQDDSIHLVLMDIQMPVMDGFTATNKIRQELQLTIPIIAMTAHAMTDEVKRCMKEGMNSHVAKPFEPTTLFKAISDCTEILEVKTQGSSVGSSTTEVHKYDLEAQPRVSDKIIDDLVIIDSKKAIAVLNNKKEVYEELIEDFIYIYHESIDNSPKLEHEQTLAFIHSFIPPLSYIGAYKLSEYALEIEQELKRQTNSNADDDIQTKIMIFTSALKHIAEHLPKKSPQKR